MGTSETRWAGRMARWFSGAGPMVAHTEAKACVQQLHSQAERAPRIVAGITGLRAQAESASLTPVYAVDRPLWAQAATQGIVSMLDEASDSLSWVDKPSASREDKFENATGSHSSKESTCGYIRKESNAHECAAEKLIRIGKLREKTVDAVEAAQLAVAMAVIAPRVLGQFQVVQPLDTDSAPRPSRSGPDISFPQDGPGISSPKESSGESLGRHGRILLVAPNILAFGTRWSLDKRDLALGVAIHEFTHAVQYEAAPWLHGYITSRVGRALAANSIGQWWEEVGEEILCVMSLVEGHATAVMGEVSRSLMPSRDRLTQALARRRSRHVLMELMDFAGFADKMEQYSRGESFVREVVNSCGHEAFNTVWESSRNIPTLTELASPHEWIRRVL